MQFGINLLPGKKAPLEGKIFRRIKLLGGIVLTVYIVLVGVLLIVSFFFSSSGQKLSTQIGQMETKIKGFAKKESLILMLKHRAEMIGEILEKKEEAKKEGASLTEILAWASELAEPGISLAELEISAGKITLSGEAQNALILGDFLEKLDSSKKKMVNLTLDSLSRSSGGVYSFSLKAAFF